MFHLDLLSPPVMGVESEKRTPQVVCYRSEDETKRLDLEKRVESEDLKPAYVLHWPACFLAGFTLGFPENVCWIWELR